MAEYIEREAVHRLVRSLNKYTWKNPDKSKYRTTVDIDDVQFGIDKIPTADMVEVRHGKWQPCFEDWRKQIEGDECSACGFRHYGTNMRDYHFCPNCGAKMDGDTNDEL